MNINVNISYLEDERSYWNSVLLVGGGSSLLYTRGTILDGAYQLSRISSSWS